MKPYREYIRESAEKNNSRLIFNLDLSAEIDFLDFNETEKAKIEKLKNNSLKILNEISEYLCAVKINRPFTDVVGLEFISELKKFGLPLIADFKLADIDNTNRLIARNAFNAGFDAVIAHAFTGEDSVKAVLDAAQEKEKGVILVVNMSHPGSKKFITPNSIEMAEMAKKLNACGVVAPATRPEEIMGVRDTVGEMLIFAPGVGAQGGKPGDAIAHGADFEMVGRSIYNAENPEKAASRIQNALRY